MLRYLKYEIKQSWRSVLRDKRDYLFLFFQFVLFSRMLKNSSSDVVLIVNIALCFIMLIRYRRINIGKIALVLVVYCLIALFPIVMFGIDGVMLEQYVGYGLKLMNACLLADYYRDRLIYIFENLVFLLACISLPLFIIQIINPHIYQVFTPLSRLIMEGRQDYSGRVAGITMHQYLIVYVLNGWGVYRNSGFMWEPAAFGAMLSWALLFNMYIYNFRYNIRMLLFLIAIFTTFSLGTLSYLIVLVTIFLFSSFSVKKLMRLMMLLLVFVVFLTQTSLFKNQYDMMMDKTESYSDIDGALRKVENTGRTNRIAGIYANVEGIKDNLLGYGMYNERFVPAPNGLVNFMYKWGVLGVLSLFFLFTRFSLYLKSRFYNRANTIIIVLTTFVLFFPMVGNPFFNHPFFLTLMVFPLFVLRSFNK